MRFEDVMRWTRRQLPEPQTPEDITRYALGRPVATWRGQLRADYSDPGEREAVIRSRVGEDYPDDLGASPTPRHG